MASWNSEGLLFSNTLLNILYLLFYKVIKAWISIKKIRPIKCRPSAKAKYGPRTGTISIQALCVLKGLKVFCTFHICISIINYLTEPVWHTPAVLHYMMQHVMMSHRERLKLYIIASTATHACENMFLHKHNISVQEFLYPLMHMCAAVGGY